MRLGACRRASQSPATNLSERNNHRPASRWIRLWGRKGNPNRRPSLGRRIRNTADTRCGRCTSAGWIGCMQAMALEEHWRHKPKAWLLAHGTWTCLLELSLILSSITCEIRLLSGTCPDTIEPHGTRNGRANQQPLADCGDPEKQKSFPHSLLHFFNSRDSPPLLPFFPSRPLFWPRFSSRRSESSIRQFVLLNVSARPRVSYGNFGNDLRENRLCDIFEIEVYHCRFAERRLLFWPSSPP